MTFSDDNPNADFSDVGDAPATGNSSQSGGTADFSDVSAGSSSTVAGGGGGTTYTVKKGDNLSKIAKHFYGDAGKWKKIHAANSDRIPNPDLIHPGLQLTIPDA